MGKPALFVLDPLEHLDPRADSSYVMITEAIRRGHEPWFVGIEHLSLEGGRAHGLVRAMSVAEPGGPVAAAGEAVWRPLSDFGVVLMRKDPPVDADFITATWILDRADTRVVNRPAGLRDLNEKLAMLPFADLIPPTRLLRSQADLRRALDDFGGRMIVKPLLGFGGREILQAKVGDPNLSTVLEIATGDGTRWTVAQAFLEAAAEGDKRILLVDGEPVGAVLRVPAKGELRDNFHAGGAAQKTPLTERDREICAGIGPMLREHGVYFSGIDVIGGYLTEINVTSPTGMQEINRLEALDGDQTMQARFWAGLDDSMR